MRLARLTVCVLIGAAHLGVWYLFSLKPRTPRAGESEELPATLFFLDLSLPRSNRPPAVHTAQGGPGVQPHRRRAQDAAPGIPVETNSPATSDPAVVSTPAPSHVDWAGEAQLAAQRGADAQVLLDKQAAALDSRYHKLPVPAPRQPEFGWYYAGTHRVEPLPQGGFLLNINDRCAVAVVIMIMPMCKFGKIEARGDLFQHMKPTPLMGDWRDKDP